MSGLRRPYTWFAGLTLVFGCTATAGIKCWTNSEGVRECGNVVPPEYAQQGHERVTHSGARVIEVEGAKSAEELAAERQAAEEKARRERMVREQAAKDTVLLHTYTTEEEIDLALEGKLSVLQARIRLTESRLAKLHANLEQLRKDAANLERAGEPVSDALHADIQRVNKQIAKNESFIRERGEEQELLRERYGRDKLRFIRLKSGEIDPGHINEVADAASP